VRDTHRERERERGRERDKLTNNVKLKKREIIIYKKAFLSFSWWVRKR
jgi:hypothetical protein